MKFGVGDLINRKWRLEKFLGRGTSGIVFLAKDELQDNREGIVKIYRARKETFERERDFLTRVRGVPHVAEIYDANYTDDSMEFPYIAEQFIEGITLDQWLMREQKQKDILKSLEEVVEGLKEIHKKEVVHYDIKPTNIIVDCEGETWLVDFGISQSRSRIWKRTRGAKTYSSPEKFDNPEGTDKRSDIYSFGCLAYEALTGRAAFEADSLEKLIEKVKFETPARPHELNPKISEDIDKIVMKCLEKKPENRFRDGEELFWHWDGAVNKRVAYVVGKIEDEGSLRKKRIQDLLISLARKDEKLIEEGKIPPGQYPYGIQKGRAEWFLTSSAEWTAPYWVNKLWIDYEETGEEKFRVWAEEWTRGLDVEIEGGLKRFELNILGCRAYYGYVPAFEITGDEFYLEKIKKIVRKIGDCFDEETGFIQTDNQNKNHIYTFTMESCVPLLAWSYRRFGDERFKRILQSHIENSVKFLIRGNGSVREIAEIEKNTLKDEINPSGSGYRTRELTRMNYGLSRFNVFSEAKREVENFFLNNLPKKRVALHDLRDVGKPPVEDSSSQSLFLLGSNNFDALIDPLILNCLSTDEEYPATLLGCCSNKKRSEYVGGSLVYTDCYFSKKLKEKNKD